MRQDSRYVNRLLTLPVTTAAVSTDVDQPRLGPWPLKRSLSINSSSKLEILRDSINKPDLSRFLTQIDEECAIIEAANARTNLELEQRGYPLAPTLPNDIEQGNKQPNRELDVFSCNSLPGLLAVCGIIMFIAPLLASSIFENHMGKTVVKLGEGAPSRTEVIFAFGLPAFAAAVAFMIALAAVVISKEQGFVFKRRREVLWYFVYGILAGVFYAVGKTLAQANEDRFHRWVLDEETRQVGHVRAWRRRLRRQMDGQGDLSIDIPSTPDILQDDAVSRLSPRRRQRTYSPSSPTKYTVHQWPSPQRCGRNDSRSTSFAYDPFLQAYNLPHRPHSMERDRHDSSSGTAEESEPLTNETPDSRTSLDHQSVTSASTTSLVLEELGQVPLVSNKPRHEFEYRDDEDDVDPELPAYMGSGRGRSMTRNLRRLVWIVSVIGVVGWALALVLFLFSGRHKAGSDVAFDHESPKLNSGRKITLDQVLYGEWRAHSQELSWIDGPNGEDGLLLERNRPNGFLVVEDVRSRKANSTAMSPRILMMTGWFQVDGENVWPDEVWPSPNLKKVLIVSKYEKNWRHSFTGNYWIFDVETQTAEPLDPGNPDVRIQLATWSPTSDSVVFTRNNNMFIRMLSSTAVRQITTDGGPEYFYGVPDWVYEEEVFQNNKATWCSRDGQYVAFLRTNETMVPEYPVQYFLSRPSGKTPLPGEEAYPEVRQIKYPKAGAPNPVVDLQFYDVARNEVFSVSIEGGFTDDDRLITEVLWANSGKVLVRESNRESDVMRLLLVDVTARTGQTLYTQNVTALDGGWVEPTQTTRFIPADPSKGRPEDGYIAQVIYKNNDHWGYFSPLGNSVPVMLTYGDWEVTNEVPAIDLKKNLLYFRAAKESPTQRHIYSVKFDGTGMTPIVDTSKPAYYDSFFSAKAGYAVMTYMGPSIPWQKVVSTPSNPVKYDEVIEENKGLADMAASHEMPHEIYSTVTVDDVTLQVVERRPPFFNEQKQYPVLFFLYGGPGSQQVDRRFSVDFQSYVASSLGYIVVTVDGRGTGFIGRKARTIVRGDLGRYEAYDQIATAKIWAEKSYVDEMRMAIWGWSYGGFMTLKTLEADAGRTFRYGMAVAPVTDWRFYDSVYTERYMHTPQNNWAGYESSAISNVTALSQNVRWLMMHGVADDNVHMQSTLTLLDKLDLGGVENYDVHVFPDSDHSIYFHNANRIVYDKLSKWLVNAFNGEWYKTEDPVPEPIRKER